jgi:hypothetical protein
VERRSGAKWERCGERVHDKLTQRASRPQAPVAIRAVKLSQARYTMFTGCIEPRRMHEDGRAVKFPQATYTMFTRRDRDVPARPLTAISLQRRVAHLLCFSLSR